MIDLKGKRAIVTGSGQGIGKAIALKLSELGASVAVSDINKETVKSVAECISDSGGKTFSTVCDVSKNEDVENMIKESVQAFGGLDILVNNAGITRDGLLLRMKETDWNLVLEINLKSVFLCCKSAVRFLMKSQAGRIINVSSVIGIMGNAGQANYSASKAGVIGLTKTLAREFASRKVTANCVAPGFICTAMTDKLSDLEKEAIVKNIPLNRLGMPDDIANVAAFLASDAASYITG
ncbi:MAG: 3-oxoacyl-[acyl-carrier-protein] reductase [bacterium]